MPGETRPQPYYSDDAVTIYHGDCRDILSSLSGVETSITDPPYGIGFMGKGWDHGVPGVEFWSLVRDALLPGAMCLAFGGTRTFHRLTCAIEDAGFEVRDCLMWLYGSGFPKSLDISKAIDKDAGHWRGRAGEAAQLWHGWGTALKPSYEIIVLAMKPLAGTFAQNALEHGVAGLNIDGARIGAEGGCAGAGAGARVYGDGLNGTFAKPVPGLGRWPANLVLDEDAAAMLDEQSGERTSGLMRGGTQRAAQDRPGSVCYGTYGGNATAADTYADSGGASRFFYTAKASRSDRGVGNDHPTVKPSDLMKWLVTLTATPTGGTVLDPFMGSGTTIFAAKELGRRAIGIDMEERYCEVAARRCSQHVLAL